MARDKVYVRLAGTDSSTGHGTSREVTTPVSKREQPLVDAIAKFLAAKRTPVGLGELGSQVVVKKLLSQQKAQLTKIRPFLTAHSDLFEQSQDTNGQLVVHLCGMNGQSNGTGNTKKGRGVG